MKLCGYCGTRLLDKDSPKLEVRVAPGLETEHLPATYCDAMCWEAAETQKSVGAAWKLFRVNAAEVIKSAN